MEWNDWDKQNAPTLDTQTKKKQTHQVICQFISSPKFSHNRREFPARCNGALPHFSVMKSARPRAKRVARDFDASLSQRRMCRGFASGLHRQVIYHAINDIYSMYIMQRLLFVGSPRKELDQ